MVDICPNNLLAHKLSLGFSPVIVKVAITLKEGKACVFIASLSLHLFNSTHKIVFGMACDLTVEWQPPFLGLQPLFAALCPVVLGLLR